MNDIYITLAVEGALDEAVARKILENLDTAYHVSQCLCRGGNGYLKTKINVFNQSATAFPFLVLTDLDMPDICPSGLIDEWLERPKNHNLLLRVVVVQIEAWVMADKKAFSNFLSIPANRIETPTDIIRKPKEFLVNLARKSKKTRLKQDLIPSKGSTAKVGPDYNDQLIEFVKTEWNPLIAQEHSDSLKRMIDRLNSFEPDPAPTDQ